MGEIRRIHETYQKKWRPRSPEDVRFLCLALAGEVGELCNEVKKDWRGDYDRATERQLSEWSERVRMEWADCRIYLELVAYAMGFDGDTAVDDKLQTLYEKFGVPR